MGGMQISPLAVCLRSDVGTDALGDHRHFLALLG
jgi:hypothetical protein